MNESIREREYRVERELLCSCAMLAENTKGRETPEEECPIRTPFQRDRDRIIHCKSFRRLKHKTQVFLAPERDHYRTRLTHTLEVSQIARTISRALRLNEDLTEAIALGHDLGHTPFGHAGERALNEIHPGGFRHYEQSVRVAQLLEKDGRGLNLTAEVVDGILNHTHGPQPATLEGRVVRISDRIAYINHDIDDAIRAGVMTEADIPSSIAAALGDRRSERINNMVVSVIENSGEDIKMDPLTFEMFGELHAFMFSHVYKNPVAKGEEQKAMELLRQLYRYFTAHPDELPEDFAGICEREGPDRAVCDYIAGMTDRYAIEVYNNLFIPKAWEI